MSAERGWIADPPPRPEHHTPGWLSEKGTGHSHFHSAAEQAHAFKWYKMMGAAGLLPETQRKRDT